MKKVAALLICALMFSGCAYKNIGNKYEVQTSRMNLLGGLGGNQNNKIIDGKSILEIQKKTGGQKGRYETDQEYENRIKSEFIGDYSFLIPLNKSNFEFNSKTGTFDVSASVIEVKSIGYKKESGYGVEYPAVHAGSIDVPIDEYVGTNAFGASVNVYRSAETNFYVVVGKVINNSPPIFYKAKGSFNLNRDLVDGFESDFAILLNGRIESPYVLSAKSYKAPTVSSPTETLIDNYFIPMRAQNAVLYNRKAGVKYDGSFYITAERTYIDRN